MRAALAARRGAAGARRIRTGLSGILDDDFERTSATTLGTPDLGAAWAATAGTWGTDGTGAYLVSATSNATAVTEAGTADVTIEADIKIGNASTTSMGIVFRADASVAGTYMSVLFTSTPTVQIRKRVAGTSTTLTSITLENQFTTGQVFNARVTAHGDAIAILVNGQVVLTFQLSSADQTAFGGKTRVGMFLTQADAASRFLSYKAKAAAVVRSASLATPGPSALWNLDGIASTPLVSTSSIPGATSLREQDNIVQDPGDPNLGTNPERLWKFYFNAIGSDGVSRCYVTFSADGSTGWTTPTLVVYTGGATFLEDATITQPLATPGVAYRGSDGKLVMFTERNGGTVNALTSTDGINFTEVAAAAIPLGGSGAWDEALTGSPCARHDGTRFLVGYEGFPVVHDYEAFGLAYGTSPTNLTKISGPVWHPFLPKKDPLAGSQIVCDGFWLAPDGQSIVLTAHASTSAAGGVMWRGQTSNLAPHTWQLGDIVGVGSRLSYDARSDLTIDHSVPGLVQFIRVGATNASLTRYRLIGGV